MSIKKTDASCTRGVSLNLPHEREELKKADISVCPKLFPGALPGCFGHSPLHKRSHFLMNFFPFWMTTPLYSLLTRWPARL